MSKTPLSYRWLTLRYKPQWIDDEMIRNIRDYDTLGYYLIPVVEQGTAKDAKPQIRWRAVPKSI